MDHVPTRTHVFFLSCAVLSIHLWLFWSWSFETAIPVIPPSSQKALFLHISVLNRSERVGPKLDGGKRSLVEPDDLSFPVSSTKVLKRYGASPSKVLTSEKKPEKQGDGEFRDETREGEQSSSVVSVAYLKVPSSTKLNYQITGVHRGVPWDSGIGVLDWNHQGDVYSLEFTFPHRSGRLKIQTSRGHLSLEEGLLPARFGDRLQGERAVHFQRIEGARFIRFSANVPSVGLQSYAQDQLSILVQLAAIVSGRLASGHPVNGQTSLQVATTHDASTWTFNIHSIANEPNLVYVDKMPAHHYDGRWELWLSAELDYLPTKWRISLYNGDFYEYQQVPVGQSWKAP